MKIVRKLSFFLLAAMLLTTCKDDVDFPQENQEIIVNAGPDLQTYVNSEVLLNGSVTGANDPVVLLWGFKFKPAGSNVVLLNSNKAEAGFRPDVPGVYVLELKVSKGGFSGSDDVNVTVLPQLTDPVTLSQNIDSDRVLGDVYEDPSLPDYLVSAEIAVNAKLTVMPGVYMAFESGKGLIINPQGILIARGTANSKIRFTGKMPVKGYWKGIFFNSNNPLNELEHAVVSFGGGDPFLEEPSIAANVILSGSDISGAALRISETEFNDSESYGLYIKGQSVPGVFAHNSFSRNNAASAYISPGQVNLVDLNSDFTGNNAFDGIETGGTLNLNSPVQWTALNDSSEYLLSSNLIISSGLDIAEGSVFRIRPGVMIEIAATGYLNAAGTQTEPVIFVAETKALSGYWKGILFRSQNDLNRLIYNDISYGGSELLPGMAQKSNISVAPTGSLTVRNTTVHEGLGYGIVASETYQLNQDVFTSNTFRNLFEGNILPPEQAQPETTRLEGEWLDWWSFTNERLTVDTTFYNRTTSTWFHGAPDPWQMSAAAGGFGLKINSNGNYTMAISQRHPTDPACFAYSAEYITGYLTYTPTELLLAENFWRSKFLNSCAADQNVDTNVDPGSMRLRYQVTKVRNAGTGDYWELKIFNPDDSSFSYYRKSSGK